MPAPVKTATDPSPGAILFGLAGVVAIAMIVTFTHGRDDGGIRPVVLYIEEPLFEANGRSALKTMAARFDAAVPGSNIEWRFASEPVEAPSRLVEAIDDAHAAVVIFGNDRFLANLERMPVNASYVVPSDFPAAYLDEHYGRLRNDRPLAFVSWYAANHDKLFELLSHTCGTRHPVVAGFFDQDYVSAGVDREFLAAAARQGIAATAVNYSDFAGFSEAFHAATKAGTVNSVYFSMGNIMYPHMREAAEMARDANVLAVYTRNDQVLAGGLMSSDAPDYEALDQMALYAYLIVNGANASSLPIAHATRYELAINLATAKRIGCQVQYETLVEATHVIE
jgi:hypothetical protein